jgi:hypothetical protein
MALTGGCLCGGVRYEVTEDFQWANYCHCTRCQRRTGTAASANALVAATGYRITAGEDLIKTYRPEDGAPKAFCGDCGSALYAGGPELGWLGVRLGTLDTYPGIRPKHRQYVDYAAVWEPIPDDGLPRYGEGPS